MRISEYQRKVAGREAGPYSWYLVVHVLLAPFLGIRSLLRSKRRRYDGNILTRLLGGTRPPSREQWVVILAAGLGEARVATRLAQELETQMDVKVRVLVESNDGVTHQFHGVPTGIAPFNSPISAWLFLRNWTPRAILSVEFFDNHHLKYFAAMSKVPMIVFNVVITEEAVAQARRQMTRRWRWAIVGKYAVLDQCHVDRMARLGVKSEQMMLSGPIGLGVTTPANGWDETPRKWRKVFGLGPKDGPVVVAGSTWPQDEFVVLRAFAALRQVAPNAVLILAPRQPGNGDQTLKELGIEFSRRSDCPESRPNSGIILLDSIGELRDVYSIADIAFVGGTFVPGNGGHSPSEALAWNVPVTLGPLHSFQSTLVRLLVENECACVVENADQLGCLWKDLYVEPDRLKCMRSSAQAFMEAQVRNGQVFFGQLTV